MPPILFSFLTYHFLLQQKNFTLRFQHFAPPCKISLAKGEFHCNPALVGLLCEEQRHNFKPVLD